IFRQCLDFVIQLIQQNRNTSPQLVFELCHAVLHSPLLAEFWPAFKPICLDVFHKFPFEDKEFCQQAMIKECQARLQSDDCLNICTKEELIQLFDFAFTMGNSKLEQSVWNRLFAIAKSRSINEVRSLCAELMRRQGDPIV